MIGLALPLPNAFEAAYFGACIVIGGAFVCSLLLVVAYLLRGGR
jgi:hypothetical protein